MAARKPKTTDFSNPPANLNEHLFYGLTLDDKQKIFRDMIWNEDINAVFCDAKAGSGKTLIAVATAVLLYKYGIYKGIHYIVAANAEGRQGFLPGTQQEKTAPYLQGLWSALETIGEWPEKVIKGVNQNPEAEKDGSCYITAESSTFLRGANIGSSAKKIVIIDESQNFTIPDLRKTLTRICDGSKAIVIGHQLQTDIAWQSSAFGPCLEHFRSKNDPRFAFCELSTCHRSLVAQVADEPWKVPHLKAGEL